MTLDAESAAPRTALHERRVEEIRSVLDRRSAAGAVLASRRTFAWLTVGGLNHVAVGSDVGAVPVLVTSDAVIALAPVNEAARIRDEELGELDVDVEEVPWERPDAADGAVRRRAGGRILRDDDLEEDLVELRSRLSPMEHERMRRLAGDLADVVDDAIARVERGTTEDAVVGDVAGGLLARGIRAPVLLAAADERIDRYRHPLPASQAVRGRLMLVAVGERHGLHVAMTRFAEPAPRAREVMERTEAARRVLEVMIATSRAGSTLGQVLERARSAYADVGFADEWRLHHQGGTIGYASRERIAVPGDAHRLEAGMAVAWNPSVTGAKAEATVLITEGEPDVLLA